MMAKATSGESARERLLRAADELFYDEGVHTVGIDRIIDRAGVAKASLYNTYGSKDELVRAYLQGRHARSAARIARHVERQDTARARVLAVFDAQSENIAEPTFNGCPFVSASAEARPGDAADQAASAYRAWMRGLFARLVREAGAAEPDLLAHQLQVLYDGAALSARLDRDPAASLAAKAAASALLDAVIGPESGGTEGE